MLTLTMYLLWVLHLLREVGATYYTDYGSTHCGSTDYGTFSMRSVNSISGSSVCPHSRYLPISRRRSAAWGGGKG